MSKLIFKNTYSSDFVMVLDANIVSNSLGFILILAVIERQNKFSHTTTLYQVTFGYDVFADRFMINWCLHSCHKRYTVFCYAKYTSFKTRFKLLFAQDKKYSWYIQS